MTIADWMAAHRSPSIDRVCQALMSIGTSRRAFAVGAVLVIVLCLVLRRLDTVVAGALAVPSATAASILLKAQLARPRPGPRYAEVTTYGYSMPSSAAALLTAGLIVLLLLVPRRRAVWSVAVIGFAGVDAVIGFALIYLGSHWFTDVCAGIVLGGLFGGAAFLVTTRLRDKRAHAAT